MDNNVNDYFDKGNEVKSQWVKFNVFGDHVAGTLTAVREMKSSLPGKEGQLVKIYEFKADGGSFHDSENKVVAKEATTIEPGDTWLVGGSGGLDQQMTNVRRGTKVAIKYVEDRPNKQKGFNATKVKKVYVKKGQDGKPVMDQEFLEASAGIDPNSIPM